MNKTRPRLSPHSSLSNSCKQSSSGSKKSPRNSRSDSPSSSATNKHGRDVLDDRLRSVLCHRLGLPLLYAFHGEDPATLKYLHKKRAPLCPKVEEGLNEVFTAGVNEWKTRPIKQQQEPQLTKILVKKINEQDLSFIAFNQLTVEGKGESNGVIDIVFSEAKSEQDTIESTPFTVIEFGLNGRDWWKKFDQGVSYVDRMRMSQNSRVLQFDKPMLLAVVTYDESCEGNESLFRIGVFLCSRKNTNRKLDEYRMSLLWHTKSDTLQDASNCFGRFLRVTADFRFWRDGSDVPSDDGYEYFSSNCCKVGNNNDAVVLRSYDSRVHKTNRSPKVYLSQECRDIVGDTTTIVNLSKEDDIVHTEPENCPPNDKLWIKTKERSLLIIAAPYRRGCHVAKRPKAFVPIINQLIALHDKGFVHGDIRAFNTVFGEQENEGWLIDFDFGGLHESTCYPNGYRNALVDGHRQGDGGGDGDDKAANKIEKWHDWYALGQMIFTVHEFVPPEGHTRDEKIWGMGLIYELRQFWDDNARDPQAGEISELIGFLTYLDEQGWTVKPAALFANALGNTTARTATKRGATGSPLEKKQH